MSAAIGPGMRVKCIRRPEPEKIEPLCSAGSPAAGSVWTVLAVVSFQDEATNNPFFHLVEWPVSRECFASKLFVPLDGNEDLSVLTGILDEVSAREKVS